MERRGFLIGSMFAATVASAANAADPAPTPAALSPPTESAPAARYGLIGRMKAVAGQRDALIAILLEGTRGMPGCLSYIVAKDAEDADALWITEVWESEAAHDASLQLPAVQAAITKGRDMIAGMDTGVVTAPVGGIGLGT